MLVRADSGPAVGTGHLMRCLALAEACRERGIESVLVTSEIADSLRERVQLTGTEVIALDVEPASREDAAGTAEIAAGRAASWVVLDGYDFDPSFQRALMQTGRRLLVVDDNGHLPEYRADVLLNQNPYARRDMYEASDIDTYLLGPRYALLRTEFLMASGRRRRTAPCGNILVTFGGADEHNLTERTMVAIGSLVKRFEVTVLVGALNANEEHLRAVAEEVGLHCNWLRNSSNVSDVMAWADLAVTAAGSTCWELAYMGTPMICVAVADNQRLIADSLASAGVALDAGWHSEVTSHHLGQVLALLVDDPKRIEAMSANGMRLIDGGGSARVVAEMLQLA